MVTATLLSLLVATFASVNGSPVPAGVERADRVRAEARQLPAPFPPLPVPPIPAPAPPAPAPAADVPPSDAPLRRGGFTTDQVRPIADSVLVGRGGFTTDQVQPLVDNALVGRGGVQTEQLQPIADNALLMRDINAANGAFVPVGVLNGHNKLNAANTFLPITSNDNLNELLNSENAYGVGAFAPILAENLLRRDINVANDPFVPVDILEGANRLNALNTFAPVTSGENLNGIANSANPLGVGSFVPVAASDILERDINALNSAAIPIAALNGANGLNALNTFVPVTSNGNLNNIGNSANRVGLGAAAPIGVNNVANDGLARLNLSPNLNVSPSILSGGDNSHKGESQCS